MLALLLKILCIVGIILLILIAVLLVALLLVLFFPITYSVRGKKNAQEATASIKAEWLFGLLRMRYIYPKPGNITMKLLWMTIFDSASPPKNPKNSGEQTTFESGTKESGDLKKESCSNGSLELQDISGTAQETSNEHNTSKECNKSGKEPSSLSFFEKIQRFFMEKYEKIRYTFQSIYDKIKHIWQNISCYRTLLEDEETSLLFSHAKKRFGKIWRAVRPRMLRTNVVFGTGSPDTTGYLFGIYGMLSPKLGQTVFVTPDFTRAVFEGEIAARGRIIICSLLWQAGRLAFDRRLRLFIKRLKAIQPLKNGGENGR